MASTTATAAEGQPRESRPRAKGTLYRGDLGMWSWVAHRITGVLTFFFLFVHVLDTALVRVSPNAYDTVINTYKHPLMIVFELGLLAAVLFHAFNGIRVMLVDFWAEGPRFQRPMLWTVLVLWLVLIIPAAISMITRAVTEMFGG
ncbi:MULTISPECIES: succinate dehydrogenase, cytochrome b556 subunit [Actinopolyspora]|uniref:Succinate dehydrogenase subunit C n=2 Tax=Actinopolyspora TaxID=1849 RepID=A0A1H1GTF9_9ACTN|nr:MULTISPECIES: succinate dehydrogenase, cytochrome b556 subunit [Actinopolyspora]NHD16771.1 succinate dehydrogenase, cytochrome b556 subunit [Actinopolyspora sp. BKK2]NHE75366.1 succinate dehydrogenase, cytochrome b556 subunit [Actinopolyspora sp. BKK1]NYH78410.1 succinate dehydrogenase / fumarate reductase cytochrome b subunit [Actinopolyspora biskrensis]SDR16188.1 succinate dehydrogenase subunit C [Actinopolyspora saharensis]